MNVKIVVNATDLYGVMMENVEKVSGLITRYAIVENMYLTKPSALKKLLESEISKLYLAVLQCMVKMSRYFGQTTAGRSRQFGRQPDIDTDYQQCL
jgi:hypothetical protein